MTKIDDATPPTTMPTDQPLDTPAAENAAPQSRVARAGTAEDQGGDVEPSQDGSPPDSSQTPPLDDPDSSLTAQSYTDAANSMQNLTIEDALIELMQASAQDKKSERMLYISGTEESYQDSMDAVAKDFQANKDKETAAIVSAAVDMGANAINMGATMYSTSMGGTDAAMMGRNQAIGAGSGAISDVGNIVGDIYTKKADDEGTEAKGDDAQAQKVTSLAKGFDDEASNTQSIIDLASQAFRQKADAELELARGARPA